MTFTRLGFPYGREKVNLAMEKPPGKEKEHENTNRSVYRSLWSSLEDEITATHLDFAHGREKVNLAMEKPPGKEKGTHKHT